MKLEETNKSEPTYEEFVEFMNSLNKSYKYLGTITPSDEAIEEVNKLIEESDKRIKKLFPYDNIDNITINDVGEWNIEGDNLWT